MSEPVKPALTAEEWTAKGRFPLRIDENGVLWEADADGEGSVDDAGRHMMAALALYGQSCGFTAEDVRDLRSTALKVSFPWRIAMLHSLADRIEALLPPENAPK